MGGVAPWMGSKIDEVTNPGFKVFWLVFCFVCVTFLFWFGNKLNLV